MTDRSTPCTAPVCWVWLALLGMSCALAVPTALAQKSSAAKKKPSVKWPDLKTLDDKFRAMEIIRNSMPAQRVARTVRFTSADLDSELERYVSRTTRTPFADIVNDETFLRRVSIDLTGTVPSADEIQTFVSDSSSDKRSRKIDELLESDAYARKWARYWCAVIFQDSPANRNSVNPQALEDWLHEKFAANARWDGIVAQMIFASPQRQKDKKAQENGWQQDDGPNNFVLACNREPELIASQTAHLLGDQHSMCGVPRPPIRLLETRAIP